MPWSEAVPADYFERRRLRRSTSSLRGICDAGPAQIMSPSLVTNSTLRFSHSRLEIPLGRFPVAILVSTLCFFLPNMARG